MKQFSFFKRENNVGGSIRADQIAPYLNARVNPTSDFENDICIYTNILPPEDTPSKAYWDLNDFWPFKEWAIEHPNVNLIAMSRVAQQFVSRAINRDAIFLPQHHCNFLRERRQRDEVKVVGLVGGSRSCEVDHDLLRERLNAIGMEYQELMFPRFRNSIVKFYKTVDIQVVWRPRRSKSRGAGMLSTPLKLANAGSFGIPTVSYPEKSYVDELDTCFMQATTFDALIDGVKRLKDDKGLYKEMADECIKQTEKYHIEHIVKRYQLL